MPLSARHSLTEHPSPNASGHGQSGSIVRGQPVDGADRADLLGDVDAAGDPPADRLEQPEHPVAGAVRIMVAA